MHGRPRKLLTPEKEIEYSKKAERLRILQSHFLKFHLQNNYSEEALKLNAGLLEKNPEYMTAWNYRKLAVEQNNDANFKEELKVAERALRKNPKSYGAWYHRKWVLMKSYPSVDLKRELDTLVAVLGLDSRNFHAWNHRRFVVELEKKSDEDELDFTTEVIEDNFSNYSAWHRRCVILSRLFKKEVEGFSPKENKLKKEYEFVHGALFTDSQDQSGWFYHLWLLNQTVKENPHLGGFTSARHCPNLDVSGNDGLENRNGDKMMSWDDQNFHSCERLYFHESSETGTFENLVYERKEILRNEIACFRELLLEEPNCKIGKLMLARLLTAQNSIKPNEVDSSVYSEVLDLYNDLISSDTPHSEYYKDECSKVLFNQLTSTSESLLSRCYEYKDYTYYICLRLRDLSLSRIGSCERLSWIQILDLSHNQISSIEGLELMQSLWCLNLSNNKIRNFSTLEPLKKLKFLKVLNISSNEIGSHTLDTTRYLCTSPFSHTVARDWNFKEFVNIEDDDVANKYWGAFSVIRDSTLTQLDVRGNAIVDEEFKLFLVKIIPTLKWLDEVEV